MNWLVLIPERVLSVLTPIPDDVLRDNLQPFIEQGIVARRKRLLLDNIGWWPSMGLRGHVKRKAQRASLDQWAGRWAIPDAEKAAAMTNAEDEALRRIEDILSQVRKARVTT